MRIDTRYAPSTLTIVALFPLVLFPRPRRPGDCCACRLIRTPQTHRSAFDRMVTRPDRPHADGFPVQDARLHRGQVLHPGKAGGRLRKRGKSVDVWVRHRVDSISQSGRFWCPMDHFVIVATIRLYPSES